MLLKLIEKELNLPFTFSKSAYYSYAKYSVWHRTPSMLHCCTFLIQSRREGTQLEIELYIWSAMETFCFLSGKQLTL